MGPEARPRASYLRVRRIRLPTGRAKHKGAIAQLGERWLCKPEVAGSIPAGSTSVRQSPARLNGPAGLLLSATKSPYGVNGGDKPRQKKESDGQLLQRREPLPKCLAVVLKAIFHDVRAVANLPQVTVDLLYHRSPRRVRALCLP